MSRKMKVPVGMSSCNHDGETYTPDENGLVEVPDNAVEALQTHGLTVHSVDEGALTAAHEVVQDEVDATSRATKKK